MIAIYARFLAAANRCSSADQAFDVADRLLLRVHTLLALYLRLPAAFAIGNILTLDDTGKKIGRRIRATKTIYVYSPQGAQELSRAVGSDTFASRLLDLSSTDLAISEALALVSAQPLAWSNVYDVIEFLGGAKEIAKSGDAPNAETVIFRRTANHYRHLGRQKPNPLPPNPPTLSAAQLFAKDLLKRWLARRVG